jgi:2-oxoglutarate ferredoxin oxidoreductase subunit beta
VTVAIAFEAPFVSRGFAGDGKHLVGLIKEGISSPGFSLVDVFQPCVSFDRTHSFQWYKERIYDVNESGHDAREVMAAIQKSKEWGEHIPVGVFYRNPEKLTYEQQSPVLKDGPLVGRRLDPSRVEKVIDSFL